LSVEDNKIVLKLYVAGRAPNSQRAQLNLNEIIAQNNPNRFELEVIDILENPMRAIEDEILVAPTLWKIAPLPKAKILGNLSDVDQVVHKLGIIGGKC